jgi:hypothetical protein
MGLKKDKIEFLKVVPLEFYKEHHKDYSLLNGLIQYLKPFPRQYQYLSYESMYLEYRFQGYY